MRSRLSILFFVLLSVITARSVYATDFKAANLSAEGQQAYKALLDARFFSVGLIGWGAQQSLSEQSLRTLLREKKAASALKSLIQKATPEGSIYGLFGLKMLDAEIFRQELALYKLTTEPPERPAYPGAENKPPRITTRTGAGKVAIMRGCIYTTTQRQKIIELLESGEYDETFRANKTGVEYILQDGTMIKPK